MCCLSHIGWQARGEEFSLESAGARFGFPAKGASEGFRSAEGFLDCNLPVSWQLGNNFLVKARIDFTVGWLGGGGEDAATASVGPTFVLRYKDMPLSLEGGSSSTLLSRHEFGGQDLGGPFQFNTHIGLSADVTRRWRIGYRYDHISNAGIYRANPGVNLHTFAVSYVF